MSEAAVDEQLGEPADVAHVGRRKIDKSLLVVSLVVALGLVLVARGLAVGITGDERADLPVQIESIEPVAEAVQVLSQTQVFVDLAEGYTGVLVIDTIELETVDVRDFLGDEGAEPGVQVQLPPTTLYESGNDTLTFTPNSGALITKFSSGQHSAQVIYWRVDEGRQHTRSYSWTFNVI